MNGALHSLETLENRRLMAWSSYAQLVSQDDAATRYPKINGSGVTVAVIDTGIDYTLASLGGGFGSKYKVIGGYDFYANDSDPKDEDGHGTAVAATVAANPYTVNGVTYRGVAPSAKLVALRVGTEDSISDSNIEKALQWVISNYKTYKISVVNLSIGSGNYIDAQTEAQTSDEFQALHDLGIFVVAASGNSNDVFTGPISQDGIAFPSADPNVFAVGAVDASDVITTWSQRGDELDLLAPGADIIVPKLSGGTEAVDGTSFASPYVAGAAALIKQADPTALAGDIGSILMSSGAANRDGDSETGNTTGLQFSRLDVNAALNLTTRRLGRTSTLAVGRTFDTALDSQGVLHASFYDVNSGHLLYATRNTSGLWSTATVIDSVGDVGVQSSIAVDNSGKVAVAYFDLTNTALKYASLAGNTWSAQTIENAKHVGTHPSLGFDIDGNAYIAYYRRSGGYLKLAQLNRDTGVWTRTTVDGGSGADVGSFASLDVGEAGFRSNGFTIYDTTVAIAYADATNGDLKYARLDVDDSAATWFIATVENANGVANIALDLHAGPLRSGVQAQIAYLDASQSLVKYAYRNTDWFVEIAASAGRHPGMVDLSFDEDDNPVIAYFHGTQRAVYTALRVSSTSWSVARIAPGAGQLSVAINERSGSAFLTSLNRARTEVGTLGLI